MKSPVVKRSIVIAGHKTSVSLEDAFWKGLKEIASGRDMTSRTSSPRSIPSGSTGIYLRPFAWSCSIFIANDLPATNRHDHHVRVHVSVHTRR
jgi:hypothetical protein